MLGSIRFELVEERRGVFNAEGREGGHIDVVVDVADEEAAVLRIHVERKLFERTD